MAISGRELLARALSGIVHPLTTMMLGDVTATDEIVIPYYENLPR